MEMNELRRTKKEQNYEKRILIRDLFMYVRRRISEEIRKQHLPKNQINILFDDKINSIDLFNQHPLLNEILKNVSQEFGISVDQMMIYLKEKKKANETFHLDMELKEYATAHTFTKVYDLNEFLKIQSMHSLATEYLLLLQPVFNQVCRIMNKDQQQQRSSEDTSEAARNEI
jgi:hypothetical protein